MVTLLCVTILFLYIRQSMICVDSEGGNPRAKAREIGNFRGVCPILNRAQKSAEILTRISAAG